MPYISKVLIAVDLSENTKKQMSIAMPIVQQLGASVVLLNCIPSLSQVPSEYMPSENIALFMEETIQNIKTQLHAIEKEFFSEMNIIIETPIGEPITIINEYATRYNCSMILIGKSYKSSFERFFLGSVASTIVSSSELPILLLG